jgi:hypothetical protein
MITIAKHSPTPRSPSASNPPSRAVRGITMNDAGTPQFDPLAVVLDGQKSAAPPDGEMFDVPHG